MNKRVFRFLIVVFVIFIFQISCKTVYQNSMFNNIDSTSISHSINQLKNNYLIQPGDEISLKIFTRKGASLVEAIRTNVTTMQDNSFSNTGNVFVVSNDYQINLPILGLVTVQGMNESELKKMLESKFSQDYQEPFIQLNVENRRAFLFKGEQGGVIALNRTPTSIFEVIAKSGGLTRHLSTSDVLIIRGDMKKPQVYKLDLSTFKGIQTSELTIQSNDIIYIPERRRALYHAVQDISPLISLPLTALTSTVSVILLIVTITK